MMSIRNSRIALVALSGLLMVGSAGAVLAQAPPQGPPPGGGRTGGGRGGVTIEALTDRLKLTPDQVEKIKPILADQQTQMAAMRADTSASQEDRQAKMMKLRTDTSTKINAVLTPDQQTEYKKMQAEQMQRGPGGGGGAPAGPPPGL
jgi:Spy/CpxP family protein refolding chaperone